MNESIFSTTLIDKYNRKKFRNEQIVEKQLEQIKFFSQHLINQQANNSNNNDNKKDFFGANILGKSELSGATKKCEGIVKVYKVYNADNDLWGV